MLLAVIGDIRGNLPALEAVLAPIDDAGIQTILNTGNALAGFPWPNEVVNLLRSRNIPSVQGETDRQVGRFARNADALRKRLSESDFERLRWAYEHTHSDNLEFVYRLPRYCRLTIEGIPIFLCHGSPASPSQPLRAEDSMERFRRQREAALARIVVCGGGYSAFTRYVDDALFVNPGSVAEMPGGKPRASYAIINTEEEPFTARVLSAPYDATGSDRLMEA